MEKEVRNQLVELTEKLLAVPFCCQELKEAGKNWLDALDTDKAKDAAKAFVTELEEDVEPIDDVIGFFESPAAAEHIPAEELKGLLAHMKDIKSKGAKYCDCPACSTGVAILELKDKLLDS